MQRLVVALFGQPGHEDVEPGLSRYDGLDLHPLITKVLPELTGAGIEPSHQVEMLLNQVEAPLE